MPVMLQAPEMGARIGVSLFAHQVRDMGITPTDNQGSEGPRWTQEQFIAMCDTLTARIAKARAAAVDDEEL